MNIALNFLFCRLFYSQEELLEDIVMVREGLPDTLYKLNATGFLHETDRSRGPNCPLPETKNVLVVGPGASSADKSLALLKAAILIIESALPIGAVDTNTKGLWNSKIAISWRSFVKETTNPTALMGCLVVLEDAISDKWMNPHAFYLLSCLQRHWKAVSDATISSISMRVRLLDSSLKYDFVSKSRKGSSNKRRNTR